MARALDLSWMDDAACRGLDINFFYMSRESGNPNQLAHLSTLRRMCAGCPVVSQCAEYGIKHEKYGFLGGLTESERKTIRGQRNIILERPEYMVLGKQHV